MLPAPQDYLLECVQPSDSDSGRYAIAKADISPGELVLVAAPYAVAFNPNQVASAMYIAARVEEWESISGRAGADTLSAPRLRKSDKLLALAKAGEYLPLTSCVTFCCSCARRISAGTAFLNYETIRQLSDEIAEEHARCEERRWLRGKEAELQVNPDDSTCNRGISVEQGNERRTEMRQKPARFPRMRSKKYVPLKSSLSVAASAQQENIICEDQTSPTQLEMRAQPLSWPERVGKDKGHSLSEDALGRGVCGCSGCGVAVYCSKTCWIEFHELHRATGACQTLRNVYPPLMRAFLTRGGGSGAKTSAASRGLSLDLWNAKNWLRRTSEEAAWEMQSLLFAALVLARCARDGFASHMAEAAGTTAATEDVAEEGKAAFPCIDEINTLQTGDSGGSDRLGVPGDGLTTPGVSIATESALPQEVETIRAIRLRGNVMVEVLDPKAVMRNHGADATSVVSVNERIPVSLIDQLVHGIHSDKQAATHTIRNPHWFDTAKLVTNLSVLNKESRSIFRRYYRRFSKLVLPWLSEDDELNPLLNVSASFFDCLSAAVQCNNFGLFDAKGDCIGVALYPEASYFNHSCVPNLCRVMCRGRLAAFYALREIRKGEPLTICYVDVHEQSTAERRRDLLTCYRFFCQCDRCRGATTTVAAGLQLCDACVTRGYLIPVPPPDNTSWRMDAVREGECSVCHHRVPWSCEERLKTS